MDSKTNKTPNYFFTIEEKHTLIKEYLSSNLSKEEFWQMRVGKSDHGTLLNWLRKLGYISENPRNSCKIVSQKDSMSKKKTKLSDEESFEMLQLKKRIQTLESQLKDAELKAIAFSTMVDIAEKEFKIPIRKKYNTKP
jgi:transposase